MNFANIKSYFYGHRPLWNLIQKSFWKGFFGPFFAFIFPLIFIAILGNILGYNQILSGSLSISPMAVTLTSMPQLIFEFKNSSLLKRIGCTPIKPTLFVFITIVFYLMIIVLSIAWCIIFSLLIFGIKYWDNGSLFIETLVPVGANGQPELIKIYDPSFKDVLSNVNWLGFIYGQITLTLIGLCLGMAIASISKSAITLQGVGISVLILSQFLSCMVLPSSLVRGIDAMWYLGYVLSPFKCSTNLIVESWGGQIPVDGDLYVKMADSSDYVLNFASSNPFDVNTGYYLASESGDKLLILGKEEKIVSLILPFVWIAGFFAISIKFFKWSAR